MKRRDYGTQAGAEQPKAEASVQFGDVPADHWAAQAIEVARSAGLMAGDENGLFHPYEPITRAEMAAIIGKWKPFSAYGKTAAFADTKGHWAEASIAAVVEQGIMKGYENGSFRPNQGLTRGEAVSLFNRVTGRGPLTGITQAIWKDVVPSHWAFAEIAEATLPHTAMKQADGVEAIADR
ncbi:S-layer homology domain-containing protein [Mesorhizobium sp. M00.F.Ca.ET.186.01.1.1]|nr:S-layer homology domain-containing protein [Mesorhizobium sp. M00.F.Ca.ET.186.01.1.1]